MYIYENIYQKKAKSSKPGIGASLCITVLGD